MTGHAAAAECGHGHGRHHTQGKEAIDMSPVSDPKNTFALFLGNRGFFPASLMDAAREPSLAKLSRFRYLLACVAIRSAFNE